MNKLVVAIVICFVVAVGYVFVQYQEIAADAEAQVEKDIVLLEASFRNQTSTALTGEHENEKYIQTQLVLQSVNEKNQFIRHYNSLFIENGERQCLQSQIIYLHKQAQILQQSWLDSDKNCLPQ